MLEIEIKARCDNPDLIEKMITAAGAKFLETIEQCDAYFNHPCRDFGVTDEAFRVRSNNNETFITYKGEKLSQKSKARFEKEMSISDRDAFIEILEKLSFRPSGIVRKTRNEYLMDGIHICVDRVEGLGAFVEFEQCGEDLAAIEAKLFACAARFHLDTFERRSYLTLILSGEAK